MHRAVTPRPASDEPRSQTPARCMMGASSRGQRTATNASELGEIDRADAGGQTQFVVAEFDCFPEASKSPLIVASGIP